jgi:hypothetical protein
MTHIDYKTQKKCNFLHQKKNILFTGAIHNVVFFEKKKHPCGASAFVRPVVRSKATRIPSPRWLQTRRTRQKGGVRPWNLLGFSVRGAASVQAEAGAQSLRGRCLLRARSLMPKA